ncbi:MAG: DJ-1/PfpI family protein [Saprospiraceae bacterium]|nr:DJ-1/PfpI family protein [Saprospiraceae bacterium]
MKILTFILTIMALITFNPTPTLSQVQKTEYICPPCGSAECDNLIFEKPGTCPNCQMTLIEKSKIKNVAIFIHDGVEVLDFTGPGEVFAASHSEEGAFNVYTVALNTDPIISQGFIKIIPEYSIENAPTPDIVVFAGGNTGAVRENKDLIRWIRKIAPELDVVLSVCTGAFILQRTGLLDGLKATTWHGAIDQLRESAPQTEVLENVRWVDNGKVITTAGISAGIDGALHVVERLLGAETAQQTARYMEYDKWKPGEGIIAAKN